MEQEGKAPARTGAAGLLQQLYLGITILVSVQQNKIMGYWQYSEKSRCVTVAAPWPSSNKELSNNHRKINHNSVLSKKLLLTGARLFSDSKSVLDFLKRESQEAWRGYHAHK